LAARRLSRPAERSDGPSLRGAALAVVLIVALAGLTVGCGSSAAARATGCDQTVLGTPGKIHPETSGMSCGQIKEMVTSISPGGQPYLFESPFTGKLWKCRARGNRPTAPLLRCELKAARFSILAVG
jgi:hypothetical protein